MALLLLAWIFTGNDELVFCHPERGSKIDHEWYAGEFRAALERAEIADSLRPFRDARHGSLTNGAAAGESPIALMTRAGHRDLATTRQYLHLGLILRQRRDRHAGSLAEVPQAIGQLELGIARIETEQ
jgi:integrase